MKKLIAAVATFTMFGLAVAAALGVALLIKTFVVALLA